MKIDKLTKEQWDKFAKEIEKNREDYKLFSEDLLRYYFIKYFEKNDLNKSIENTFVEEPYIRENEDARETQLRLKSEKPYNLTNDTKSRCRADLYYSDEGEVIEFKFHRKTDFSNSCTATKLGSVLNDFNRLSLLENNKKYSIYFFDEQMKKYYVSETKNNNSNKFDILNYDKVNIGDTFCPKTSQYTINQSSLKSAFNSFDTKSICIIPSSLHDFIALI